MEDTEELGLVAKCDEESEEESHPKASWQGMSWLLLSDVVGSSVLSFSGVTASLGWLMSIGFMVIFCYLAYYSAVLMSSARELVEECCGVSPGSMGETARLLLGERAAKITFILVYGLFAFLGNASYLLVCGTSLQDILGYWDLNPCAMTTSFYACLLVLPLAVTIRRLRNVAAICFANLFLILAVLCVCLSKIASDGRVPDVTTHLIEPTMTMLSFCQAMANILYAYAGHWMYFEIMAEMSIPKDFPKVFWINAPLQLSMYMTVAIVGYYYVGSTGEHYLVDNLEKNSKSRLAVQFMLFLHIAIVYLIKNVALARFLVGHLRAEALDADTARSKLIYAACSTTILALGWVVANAMPVFYDLLGLIGALLCGPISFVLPITFYLLARVRKDKLGSETEEKGGAMDKLKAMLQFAQSSLAPSQSIFMLWLVGFIGMIMVTGSTSSIKDIHRKVQAGNATVFSCD